MIRILFYLFSVSHLFAAAERPNIIFLLTDDHRRDDLGCYGNSVVETPHLDAMAAEGVLFENASITSAICTPSRITYLLGQYERKHGINFNSGTSLAMAAWAKSYPVILRENGYFTGYVGKNHCPIGAHGYETGLMEQSFDFWYAGHGHIRFYPKNHHQIFKHAKNHTQMELVGESVSEFLSGKTSYLGGAEQFLQARPKDQPFCLSICLNVPHSSSTREMKLLPEDDALYRTTYREQEETLPLPANYLAKSDIKTPKLPAEVLQTQFRQKNYNYVDEPATNREIRIRQYQTITGVDRMLGKIREQLEALKLADNTVIIMSSDHGLFMGEHGLGGKALNYETCLAVPFIVYDPRLPDADRGQRRDELVQAIDLAPTLLDLAGVAPENEMQGKSVLPLVRDEKKTWREYAFAENLWSTYFGNPRIESVRGMRWKYLRYFATDRSRWAGITKESEAYQMTRNSREQYEHSLTASIKGEQPIYEELYDLENDPQEVTNLAGTAEHQHILEELQAKCQELVAKAHGPITRRPLTVPLSEKNKSR